MKRFEIMEKFYLYRALLKMAGRENACPTSPLLDPQDKCSRIPRICGIFHGVPLLQKSGKPLLQGMTRQSYRLILSNRNPFAV